MKALLSIILVTILQIPIISGIFHTIEDNHDHYVCEDQRLHLHELSYECEICFLTNATFVYHSDISETNSLVFDFSSNSEMKDIENEKFLINSRVIAEDVIRRLWESKHRNNLNVLGTRNYIPTGYIQKKYMGLSQIISLNRVIYIKI